LLLKSFRDTGMKRASRFTQKSAVGRVLNQSMFEKIGRVRGHTLPEEQTCIGEQVERRAKFWLPLAVYSSYQSMRRLLERWGRNMPKPKEPRRLRSSDPTPIDVDERVNTLIAAERDFIIEVVGRAIGEFHNELIEEIEKMIAEEVKKLRTKPNLKRESNEGEVVMLPNPFLRRAERE
jgi:hypothetical protein